MHNIWPFNCLLYFITRYYDRKEQKDRAAGKKVGITFRMYLVIWLAVFGVLGFAVYYLYNTYWHV
ncbi:MAG: hypothetical protein H6550_09525 [Chitinophagales bacterium]|nr:hypothetical protein [Chitinophagales bacterium]